MSVLPAFLIIIEPPFLFMQQHIYFIVSFNLDSAIECKKGALVIGMQRKLEKLVASKVKLVSPCW